MELQDIKQNSLVVEFETVDDDWDRYAFITQCTAPWKIFGMFLEWCAKNNDTIKEDVIESNINEIFHNTFVELQNRLDGSDEFEKCEIPLIVGNHFYLATMSQENEWGMRDRVTGYLGGSLSVRRRHGGGLRTSWHDETVYRFRAFDVGTLLGLDDDDLDDDDE